jgi:uncharacterized protein
MAGRYLELADYRRRVIALYDEVRGEAGADRSRLEAFRATKDRLFRTHPQSPVPEAERASFEGLRYWPHDPAMRLLAPFEPDSDGARSDLPASTGGGMPLIRIGQVSFPLEGVDCRLGVYWFDDYAGGIFIPFRDATNGGETYGGGRYLWDSAKGADLGLEDSRLVLDFNYAYHPSCVYDARWSCPLAPVENRLDVPVRAGECL